MPPRRGNRSSLIDDDALLGGSSDSRDTAYQNFSIDGSDTPASDGLVGTMKGWWADDRKRKLIIGAIVATVVLLIIIIAIAAAASSREHGSGTVTTGNSTSSSSSSSTGALAPTAISSSTGSSGYSSSSSASPPPPPPASSSGGGSSGGSGGYSSSSSSSSALPPPPPPQPETPWLSPRLPSAVRPSHYDIYEAINIDQRVFGGTVDILLDIAQPIDHLVLHSVGLTHSSVSFTNIDGTDAPLVAWMYTPNAYLVLNFTSDRGVAPQSGAKLSIAFGGVFNTRGTGLFLSGYYANDTAPAQYMASTQFESFGARMAFPCFDEPAMKATFGVTLKTTPNYPTVLSNMPAIRTNVLPSGEVETTFNKSVVMSTYLLAYAVTDYVYSEQITLCTTTDGWRANITTRVWAPNGLYNSTIVPARIAAAQIAYYCRYFDVPYPLPKEDHILVPSGFGGAMENWGLITYGRGALLWDPAVNDIAQLIPATVTIAHEIAHQWFGNLVTAAWWTSLWLNEGFATFVEYIGADYTNPDLLMMDQFITTAQASALRFDSGPRAHRIDDGGFDNISYDKGGSIIRMMEALLGRSVFLDGIKRYLLAKSYQNAVGNDLFAFLDAANARAGKNVNVTAFMQQWTDKPGYPLLNCTTYISDGSTHWTCHQSRYFSYANPPADTTIWQIPMTGSSSRGPAAETIGLWSKPERTYEFVQPDGASWLKLNGNSTGFYRVMYDRPTYIKLSGVLNAPDFGGMWHDDRLGLISDVFEFAARSIFTYAQAMEFSLFLQHDRAFTVWQVAHPDLSMLYNRLRYTKAGPWMEEYMQQALTAAASSIDVLNTTRASAAEEQLVNIIGSSILRFNSAGKRDQLLTIFNRIYDDWPFSSFTDIDPNLVYLVLQAGVANGTFDKAWKFVYVDVWEQKLLSKDDPAPALSFDDVLNILASPRQPSTIHALLNSLNTTSNAMLFTGSDTVQLLIGVAANDIGLPLFNDWIAQPATDTAPSVLSALNSTLSPDNMRALIANTLSLNTNMDVVAGLFNVYNDAGLGYDISRALLAGRTAAQRNVDWLSQYYQPLEDYLSAGQWRRRDSSSSSSTGGSWH